MLKIRYNSPVIITFSILCSIIFLVNYYTDNSATLNIIDGIFSPYVTLPATFNYKNILNYFTLFSYILGHGSIEHLLGNMSFTLLLGPIIEERYGGSRLFAMMIFTAIITGILNIFLFDTGLMGASGIVFMLIILVSFSNVKDGGIPLTFILIMMLYVGMEVLNSFKDNNVSEFAHIAGGVIGSLFGFVMQKK